MEKRKWLWKRKSTDSSGSLSSPSDEQDPLKESPNNSSQSPEYTSRSVVDDEFKDSIKSLTDKLSAALVNVSAKEDLVKQHVKVAEEAVAGWEKAENEVAALKQQLEAAVQQNVSLEVRATHLDGALKECVRQLRQSKEEQEQRISGDLVNKTSKWESIKAELEVKILDLQVHKDPSMSEYLAPVVEKVNKQAGKAEYPSCFDPSICLKLDSLEKENSMLKAELLSCSEELEIRTIERDLSTQVAETSSKQQLESMRKLAKIEAECRRVQSLARKSSNFNDQKSTASSTYVESLTDSQSDSGELLSSIDLDVCKKSKSVQYDIAPHCSDSWASALIAELDQFKNEKATTRNLNACPVEIDMDDFLEMERLAAIPESESKISYTESCDMVDTPSSLEKAMKTELENTRKCLAELEEKLEKMEAEKDELEKRTGHLSDLREKLQKIETENTQLKNLTRDMSDLREKLSKTEEENTELQNICTHVAKLEEKLEKMEVDNAELGSMRCGLTELKGKLVNMEAEKAKLEKALDQSQKSLEQSKAQLEETETRLQEFQVELALVNETKEMREFQLIHMEAEARTTAEQIDSLKAKIEKEKSSSAQLAAKCLDLQNELNLKSQVVEIQQTANSHNEVKLKQEDLDVAADKLSECQKTIASLGRQLESLATLEDFLIDTANLPGFSAGASVVSRARGEPWKLRSTDTRVSSRTDLDPSDVPEEIPSHRLNGNDEEEAPYSSSWASSSNNNTSKIRNGFGKLFSRSRNGIHVENNEG
ncbi:hypothetical protein LIER_27666 [Lithospermum erythrorhizon]|uniref:Filament-like plant protein n=1 Tax=Lithospermum erythrorhizon TaxID=34254 RepID=A0AAV3RGR8_LITER